MTRFLPILALLLVPALLIAQSGKDKIAPRFGIDADIDQYPQATPKDTLRSVLKAIDAKRIDYMLAHLADPAFVDKIVKDNGGGKFEPIVKEVTKKYENDPETIRDLRKFLSDGVFPATDGNSIEVKCPDVKSKQLFLKKVGNRWFLEDRKRSDKPKEKDRDADKKKDDE